MFRSLPLDKAHERAGDIIVRADFGVRRIQIAQSGALHLLAPKEKAQ